jgi:maleylacetoacetate isomerase
MSRVLHGYWRSSAAYRVRIALGLKGLTWETAAVDLVRGDQRAEAFSRINPNARVPVLVEGGTAVTQSLAIIEYLDELHPDPPLLPRQPLERARVREACHLIACDIHPLGNSGVLAALRDRFGADEAARQAWSAHWIARGFAPLDAMAATGGPYLLGRTVTMADVLLVPQMYNARRFGVDLAPFPRLVAADAALAELPAFQAARPEAQPDAPALA